MADQNALLKYIAILEDNLKVWEGLAAYKDINMISSELQTLAKPLKDAKAAVASDVSAFRAKSAA